MGTIIFIIIGVILIAYIIDTVHWLAFNILPITLAVVFFPIMPYYVAYINRKEKPRAAKGLVWFASISYIIIAICILILNNLQS